MIDILENLSTAIVTGVVSGALTLIAIKNDVSWIKSKLTEHAERIVFLERKRT